jgi:hypothetical protein
LPLKGLLSETCLFNKKSRTPVLRPLISFVVSRTQSVSDRNADTRKLYPPRLTQGTIVHRYFCEGGQARFPALSSYITPHTLDGPQAPTRFTCLIFKSHSNPDPVNQNVGKQRKKNYVKIIEISASLAFLTLPMEQR